MAYSKLAYPIIDNYPLKENLITLHKNNNSVHPPHKIYQYEHSLINKNEKVYY